MAVKIIIVITIILIFVILVFSLSVYLSTYLLSVYLIELYACSCFFVFVIGLFLFLLCSTNMVKYIFQVSARLCNLHESLLVRGFPKVRVYEYDLKSLRKCGGGAWESECYQSFMAILRNVH